MVGVYFLFMLPNDNIFSFFFLFTMLCCLFSCVWLLVTLWIRARQAPLSMGFSRQEYWSGLPCPPSGDLPNPGIDLRLFGLLHWQAVSLSVAPSEKPPFYYQFSSVATHSSTLAWKIPWMEEPGRLQSMGLRRVGHDWAISLHSSVQSLSHFWLFVTPWTIARQASLSITNSWSLFKLIHWAGDAIQPSHPLSSPSIFPSLQYFPASGSLQMSQFFASGGQSIGASASASVLPMNIQDWFLLGCTGWISLQSKGFSSVFSNTTVKKHQFFSSQLSLYSYFFGILHCLL